MKPEERPEYWNIRHLRRWVKSELAMREMTQEQFSKIIGTHSPKISEAIHGKPYSAKLIPKIVQALGGNIKDFVKGRESNE